MKKKLIVTSEWWSVGECAALVNLVLNVCDYVNNNYKDDVYIIYHFMNEKFIYENVIDIDHVKTFVDEVHFTNPSLHINKLYEQGYVKIWDWVYVHKDDLNFFNEIFKFNQRCPSKYEVFETFFPSNHPINIIRHEVEILYRDYEFNYNDNSGYPKSLLQLSKTLKSIVKKYNKENKLKNYDVIHFRWNNRCDNTCGLEVVDYLVSRLSEVLDTNKTYFVSTNYSLFITQLKTKFKNILFIDRGDADFSVIESGIRTGREFPKFINEKILKSNPNMIQLSNFMAHVEMEIINNSQRVIHCSEISRNIISLFLWIPLLMNNVELLWIACGNNVKRKYNFNGCYEQVVLDPPKVKKPKCIQTISHGRCV
jgi:hypothetical protein